MSLTPIASPRLYQKVADQITQLILNGEFQPGQKLPGERALIERLGVSRSSLREALISLEITGLVEIRDRAGIFVHEKPNSPVSDPVVTSLPELFAARELIEIEVAGQAARHAQPAHIEALMQSLGQMVICLASDSAGADFDRSFHLTLAQACGNRALLRTMKLLWDSTQHVIDNQSPQAKHSESSWQSVVMEHRDIFHAIREKNTSAAQSRMRHHLAMSKQRLSGAWH